MDKKLYLWAAELVEAKREATNKVAGIAFDRIDQLRLAFTYVRREQWPEAEAAFEQAGDWAVETPSPGPWGDAYSLFLPGKAAAYCRAKAGRPPLQRADRFDFGKPCLHLSGAAIAGTDDAIWIALPGTLYRLSLDLATNLQARLPADAGFAPVTALAIGPSKAWIGTAGGGLLEFDNATGSFRHWTQQDGLLLDLVACLRFDGQTLWIGFGADMNSVGGFGKLDPASGRFTMFTPSITHMPATVNRRMPGSIDYRTPAEGPPRLMVHKLEVSPDLVWLISLEGIRSYQPSSGAWKLLPLPASMHAITFTTTADELTLGFELWQFPMPPLPLHKDPARSAGGASRPFGRTQASSPQDFESTYGIHSPGLALCALGPRQWSLLTDSGSSLPGAPGLLVARGEDLWVAGAGFVAVFDRKRDAVRRFCPIGARWVDSLDVFGGYVWVKFNRHLYRAPLSAAQYARRRL